MDCRPELAREIRVWVWVRVRDCGWGKGSQARARVRDRWRVSGMACACAYACAYACARAMLPALAPACTAHKPCAGHALYMHMHVHYTGPYMQARRGGRAQDCRQV